MEYLSCLPACLSHLFLKLVSPNRFNKPPGKKARVSNWQFLFLAWALICVPFLKPCPTLGASLPLGGKIVYVQGDVKVRTGSGPEWVPAKIDQSLYPEDAVKTGPLSRAAILCVDESQIKLNENTLFILKNAAQSSRLKLGEVVPAAVKEIFRSLYTVPQGEIWLRNSNEKFRFELETPAVTIGIRGTELNLQVSPDGTTRLVLLHGALSLENPLGRIDLHPGEEGFARPGQAPTKRVLLTPADAVQWSLYYPGIFSYRDLPLSTSTASPLDQEAVAAYNQGNHKSARQAAENALARNPGDPYALTVLGWLSLQRHALEEAEGFFRRVQPPTAMSAIGLALACYRRGDVVGAYTLSQQALKTLPPFPTLTAMAGYFALLAGQVAEARGLLEQARQQGSVILASSFLAQMNLVQNRKIAAQEQAAQALAQGPDSPQALLTQALVEISRFDLPKARHHLENALKSDPGFIQAYVYLARLWLGSDYLDRAWRTIEAALRLAPKEGEVLALAGFVRLGFRDYDRAKVFFEEAVKVGPGLGEPHLGLGHYSFRYRDYSQGLAEILTATLLEPRVSLYQSDLGRALYQVRAFDKAMETYDYAKTLDPRDPTPYLYKGIALTDLNRPGEAIQEINRSIELNDNQAIFRSRTMLDRDLAVRNYDLANAYAWLGLNNWAYSKALTAVKYDPTNSSAHLFLAGSYGIKNQGASNSEYILYRLLAPANQNTFTELGTSTGVMGSKISTSVAGDYTPMFEMPYARVQVQSIIGTWDGGGSIQDYFATAYGGMPGVAFRVAGRYGEDRGFRPQNADSKYYANDNFVKWDFTVKDSLYAAFNYTDDRYGDNYNLNDYAYQNDTASRYYSHWRSYQLGYVHRFSPQWRILAFLNYEANDNRLLRNFFTQYGAIGFRELTSLLFPQEGTNLQLQNQLILGNHTLMAGLDYYSGHLKLNYQDIATVTFLGVTYPYWDYRLANKPPERAINFYLFDYWRPISNLVVEAGLFREISKNFRYYFADPIYSALWGGALGINYQVNTQNILRLAVMRRLATNFLKPTLIPTDVAGFISRLDVSGGSRLRQAGFDWETQWDALTFSVLRVGALRIDTPDYAGNPITGVPSSRIWQGWKEYYSNLSVNRILTPFWGLSLSVSGKRFQGNLYYEDFSEIDGGFNLSFLYPSGWMGSVGSTLIKQYLENRGNNLYALANLGFGKQFAHKRGFFWIQIDNLFNRHFYYHGDVISLGSYPVRRFLFTVGLNF